MNSIVDPVFYVVNNIKKNTSTMNNCLHSDFRQIMAHLSCFKTFFCVLNIELLPERIHRAGSYKLGMMESDVFYHSIRVTIPKHLMKKCIIKEHTPRPIFLHMLPWLAINTLWGLCCNRCCAVL